MFQYFKTVVAAAALNAGTGADNQRQTAMEADTIQHGRSSKSHTSRRNFLYVVLIILLVAFSGCSHRFLDFTVISSKNHGLQFDVAQGKRTEGKSHGFLGLGATLKGAVDKALENAGAGYDVLVDGVVYREDFFFVSGWKVTGTAVRSRELRAHLGEEGFQQWLKANNVFDPETATVQNVQK